MTTRGRWGALLAIAAIVSAFSPGVRAQSCEPAAARVISVQGDVEVSGHDRAHWREVQLDQVLCGGQQVRLMAKSRTVLQLPNETLIHLDEGSVVTLRAIEREKPAWLELLRGTLHIISRVPRAFNIRTPFVNAGTEGTEFALQVGKAETALWVYEGRVRLSNPVGQLLVASGEAAIALQGQAPQRRIVAKPRRAVEWALYYPPLLDTRPERYPEALRGALFAYRQNDFPAAFARLEAVPPEDHIERFFTLRAGLLLSVGRVAEAERDIATALKDNPKEGTALALRAVIAVVRNATEEALRFAQEAVTAEPSSPTPYVARSYAEQSAFEIEKAQQSIQQASRLAPEDALVWARLAEIEISRGDLDASLEAARRAEQLDPGLSRAQSVLGFAYFTRIEVDRAKTAFERAIALDPADPLPRLGLGLAKIRDGDLDAGTKEIEIAAALDPNNSLVRSYLGKAYYEQKRGGLAETEFEQAKLLDPNDPTPWFYSAIHKQTTNRPVEALHDLEAAIERNDNRAVYRSRLSLDEDRATRSTSLGRIYTDLGFELLAVIEASESISIDPANHSAHRFLSDTYLGIPRQEVARGSELLQAQLLQPINSNPVRPSRSESELNIVGGPGPADIGFNEFTPLFERNRARGLTSVFGGNNGTWGDEVVLSGLYDRIALSLGQFHSNTDGFRENNDAENDIYDAFAQVAVTPSLDFQAEYRRRESEQGDLRLSFIREDDSERSKTNQDTGRLGAHWSLSPQSDLIVSGLYSELNNEREILFKDFGARFDSSSEERGFQVDAQYLFKTNNFNLVTGVGVYKTDVETSASFAFRGQSSTERFSSFNREQYTAYLYGHIQWPKDLIWTIGGSYDSFQEFDIDVIDDLHPKLGLQWNLTDDLRLRLAYIETVKRALLVDQTIEPTQVAAFNQFFDDFRGTRAKRYGIGLDARFAQTVYGGLEASNRDLVVPLIFNRDDIFEEEWREQFYRAYLYWTPFREWVATAEYRWGRFKIEEEAFRNRPTSLDTMTVPLTLSYFNPGGFFARFGMAYVRQEIERKFDFFRFEEVTFDDTENFVVLNASVGYRLPKRWGIVTFGATNILDEEFRFQDDSFRSSTATGVPDEELAIPGLRSNVNFLPDRMLFATITLSF
ncbi:MAG: TonB-dependent receptor domain-containing protein [Acidobacteriota bacterium]